MNRSRLLFTAGAAAAMLLASCSAPFGLLDSGGSNDPAAKSTTATLSELSVSDGTAEVALSPAFAAGTASYTANVATGTTSVTISATKTDSGATISGAGPLTLGEAGSATTATITVTAEDGTTAKTYTVNINRASASASTEARLSALTLSTYDVEWTLDPVFDSDTHEYALSVGNLASNVVVAATAVDSNAVITGAGTKTLAVGANSITVTATAEDGVAAITYTIVVTRREPDSTNLGSLSASAGILSPDFDPNTYAYTISLPNAASSVIISAAREYDGPALEYSTDGGTTFAAFTGSFCVADIAEGGSAAAVIRVISREDTDFNASYTITVNRAAAGASSDAALSALSIGTYIEDEDTGDDIYTPISISPVFDSGTYAYTATVSHATDSVSVRNTTADSAAVASIGDGSDVPLAVGSNTIAVTVTAADGTTQRTYTIIVTRQAAPVVTIASPAASAELTAGPITVTGTYSGSGVAGIELSLGSATGVAALGDGTFSGTLDATAVPNGTQSLVAAVLDQDGNELALDLVQVTITGSSTTSHPVSGNISNSVSFSGTAYLWIFGMEQSAEMPSVFSEYTAVTPDDFPYAYSLDGFVSGTAYEIGAVLLSSTPFAADWSNVIGTAENIGPYAMTGNITGADLAISDPRAY